MTTKLNLTNLIEHFTDKNPKVATRLANLTKQAEEDSDAHDPFESALLKRKETQLLVESLNRKSTIEEFNTAKDAVQSIIETSDQFSPKKKLQNLAELALVSTPTALIKFFYNKILAAEGLRVIATSSQDTPTNLHSVVDSLVEVANKLDLEDPTLAKEADQILESLLKQAQLGEWDSWDDELVDQDEWDSESEDSWEPEQEVDAQEHLEIVDPDLEEPSQEPECDEVSIDDLQDRVNNMKWRLADKTTKERFQKALEHAHRAKQYLDAHKKYKDVAHSIFDKAGDKLRFKFD